MLLGTTYAWFTDSVESGVNKIIAGNLDVELYYANEPDGSYESVESVGDVFVAPTGSEKGLWEPGHTEVAYLKVVNNGDLALKYSLQVKPSNEVVGKNTDGGDIKLSEILKFGATEPSATAPAAYTRESAIESVKSSSAKLTEYVETGMLEAGKEHYVALVVYMPETVGNEANYRGADKPEIDFAITLFATQAEAESDSFGSDYDNGAFLPTPVASSVLSGKPTVVDNKVSGNMTVAGDETAFTAKDGLLLDDGVDTLTLEVTPIENSKANIVLSSNEISKSADVHLNGMSDNNTVPAEITLYKFAPAGLNLGNFDLYHVENGNTVTMTVIPDDTAFSSHNEYKYDPATGDVTINIASCSEIALVSNTVNAWNGTVATAFAGGEGTEEDPYLIANADQLAYLNEVISNENETYGKACYKLIADINLGGEENANKGILFYPVGYHKAGGDIAALADDDAPEFVYESDRYDDGEDGIADYANGRSGASAVAEEGATWYTYGGSFKGTFDGNGNKIANIYQNTWQLKGNYSGNYWNAAMGIFGYVNGGTVKNLTVDNFSSDGEFTPTGVIAAYAANATFENIAITNCNPRVYNTGNGGIVGIGGNSDDPDTYKLTFTNITIDNTNKITALWGSWDVACGGLVGMFRGAGHVYMTNCHVGAQIDVYNDVCGNYQYYWYRYSGMMIGTNKNMKTDDEGYTVPETDKFHAENCTVHFGEWNDYYYCELVANSLASYTHDHQFSRLEQIQNVSEIQDGNGNWNKAGNFILMNGTTPTETCYHIVNKNGVLTQHNHADAGEETVGGKTVLKENNQRIYLPFNQLFTGYGWGVKHIPVYNGEDYAFDGITILDREVAASVEKFETKFTGNFLYRVGNKNTVSLGSLFAAKDGVEINDSGVWVKVEKVDENTNVSGTFSADTDDWTKGTIQFSGTGVVKVTIQDYNYCTPTVLYLEVVDAVNATTAMSATSNNVVLLNDIGSGFTVSGRYTVYGNGFTLNYTGNGQYLNNGLKQGLVTVNENGTIDNLRIITPIYPAAYMYYGSNGFADAVQDGPSTVEGDKTRYHYQLSAVALSGNGTVSNCYIYGGRNNIFVNTGDVTIKDTILECGVVANMQIQSNSSHTITLENVTTIQYQVNPTIGDTSKVMLGAGVLVGPDTTENPNIVLNGSLKQYNWITSDDANAVSDTKITKAIIEGALNATAYNHTVNGKTASNLGIIYLNTNDAEVTNNTGLPYAMGDVSITVSGQTINGKAYSLQGATSEQIYSDYANADKSTVNGYYTPQFSYTSDLGGQYIAEGGDEHCYREGDTIYVMFPISDAVKTLDISKLVDIQKYSGQDMNLQCFCTNPMGMMVAAPQGKLDISNAGNYTLRYEVTDTLFYNENGETVEKTVVYTWDVTVSVSLKDVSVPDAYYEFDSAKQTMGYAKKSIFAGGNTQYLAFLSGLKIYDYNYGSETPYLRFDGDKDFNKIAAAEITGYTSANHVLIKVTLTDGGVITVDTTARAAAGGSTYTGALQTSGNTLYYVNGGTTSATTTTWVISNYSFIGNNGVAVDSGSVTFANCENGSVPGSSFGTTINYTVSYDANGGKCGQAVSYATSASSAVALPTPTRSGYIFLGWYTAASGGAKIGGAGESYTPSANITLYAQWVAPFNVTYDANGGSCDTSSAYYDGTALTLPTATRDGYWFIGWYDAATGGNKIGDAGATYNPLSEITLYAHWQEQIEYTVTYDANGGSCKTASATYEGTALTLPTPDNRTGYTFNGWYDAATGGTRIGDAGATYSPSSNITLYAQWTVNSYAITVTTNNAELSGVTNGEKIAYGTTVSVTVSFKQSKNKTFTVKNDTTGETILSQSAEGTYTFTMPASSVTINASSDSSCVTGDTLITLADGTQKRIDQITYEDKLLVWDFFKGEYDVVSSAIIFDHGMGNNTVIELKFSDGTSVKVVNLHQFFDADLNKYVSIDADTVAQYVGHQFAKSNGNGFDLVTLVDYTVSCEYIEAWGIISAEHYNIFVEGMLSTDFMLEDYDLFNYFAIGDDMKYDAEQMQADIEKYGLYTYDDFADYLTYEQFVAFNVQYFKIPVEKGVYTYEGILELIGEYL